MRIIVTGGAGFIGSNLVDALINKGYEVLIIDNLSTGKKEFLNSKAKFHNLDIRNLDDIKSLFEGIDVVFHLAAQARIQPSIIDPKESHGNNVIGTFNVLLASRDAKIKKFIYSASSSAYGDQKKLPLKEDFSPDPKNPYALFKLIGEKYCQLFYQLYGLPTVSLRYFNVYGPRQSLEGAYATVVGIFLCQMGAGESLTIVGDGEQTRDFTHVRDVVRANILAMKSDKIGRGEIINIGAGQNHSINRIAKLVGGETTNIPSRPGEARHTLADIVKAKQLLDWEPTIKIEEGIEELKKLDN